jgi:TonB family protein
LIGTVGIHLLLLTILIVGPAFFNPQPKIDNNNILTVIPANLVDAAISSGAQDAQAPPPTPTPISPAFLKPPPPLPAPAPAPRVVQPAPAPAPEKIPDLTPTPSLLDRWEKMFERTKPAPTVTPDMTPTKRTTTKSQTDNINVDLSHKISRTKPLKSSQTDNAQNQREINRELNSLTHSLSSATKIDMPGNASASYANYGDVVVSIYHSAWVPPDGMSRDNVPVKFKVTIARDGSVISAQIIDRSGDPSIDEAVQHMLDRVTFIEPFPQGTDDKQRTYTIDFNAIRTTE